uniref:Uncharacterized protein n=1 Tax=Cacopsylla melanoneura TaxID=428564 RepID=A0A8D9B3S2_9HEMI
MKCTCFITMITTLRFAVVSQNHDPWNPYNEPISSFEASDIKKETVDNTTKPYMVSDPFPEEILEMNDSMFYEKYVEDEYLKNLNERSNDTLILLGKDGYMHPFTKTYLQRRMLNLVIPIANSYAVYLRKHAIKKPYETEADFRYNANKAFLKKKIIDTLQFFYFQILFQHLPRLRREVIDSTVKSKNGSMTRLNYYETWDLETNYTIQICQFAHHLSEARNNLLQEADTALYSAMKPAYYNVELNNVAFNASPFESHHFQIKR